MAAATTARLARLFRARVSADWTAANTVYNAATAT